MNYYYPQRICFNDQGTALKYDKSVAGDLKTLLRSPWDTASGCASDFTTSLGCVKGNFTIVYRQSNIELGEEVSYTFWCVRQDSESEAKGNINKLRMEK